MVKVSMVRMPAGLEVEVTRPRLVSANCPCSMGSGPAKARCKAFHLLDVLRAGPTEETEVETGGTGAEAEE